jgi:tRNA pseudouridine55 synthase
MTPSGIVLIDKRSGITSFDALGAIKRALGTKKIGHTGTLDSFASGLLVALAGDLTRVAPYITALPKTYRAVVRFGNETDTLDPSGSVIRTAPLPTEESFRASLPRFTGNILQEPPKYSALKICGKRASDLSRAGKTVEMKSRPVTVYALEVTRIDSRAAPSVESAEILVTCSAGTYIRSLARDIANASGSAGHLTALRRLSVGTFSVDDARAGDSPALLPMTPDLSERCGLPPLFLDAAREKEFRNGGAIRADWFTRENSGFDFSPSGAYAVFTKENIFSGVALYEKRAEKFSYGFVCAAP